jgi:hypothetical protein
MFICIAILRNKTILAKITEHYDGELRAANKSPRNRDKTFDVTLRNYVSKAITHNLLLLSANSYETICEELQCGFLSKYNYLSNHRLLLLFVI